MPDLKKPIVRKNVTSFRVEHIRRSGDAFTVARRDLDADGEPVGAERWFDVVEADDPATHAACVDAFATVETIGADVLDPVAVAAAEVPQ